jgi:hypothetical protein
MKADLTIKHAAVAATLRNCHCSDGSLPTVMFSFRTNHFKKPCSEFEVQTPAKGDERFRNIAYFSQSNVSEGH